MRIKITILILLTFFCVTTNADYIKACKNCNPKDLAIEHVKFNPEDGDVVSVIVTDDLSVKTYKVTKRRFISNYFYTAVQIETTRDAAEQLDYFQRDLETIEIMKNAPRTAIHIPSNLPNTRYDDNIESAHDLIGNSRAKREVMSYIQTTRVTADYLTRVYEVVALIGILADKINAAEINLPIVFADGSHGSVRLSGVNDIGFPEFRLSTSVDLIDNEGNTIPRTREAIRGQRFLFEDERNLERMRRLARQLDWEVRDSLDNRSCLRQLSQMSCTSHNPDSNLARCVVHLECDR